MTSYLVDINVWLALTWDQHPQHAPASDWYRSIDDVMLLFCRFTMLGFLRLLSPTAI
jgi:predicted nucleic acid-binding protein